MSYQDAFAQRRYGDYIHQYSVAGRAGSHTRSRSRGLSFRVRSLACGILGVSFYRDLDLAIYCVKARFPGGWELLRYLGVREEIMWTCSYKETPAHGWVGEGYGRVCLVGCTHQLHVRISVSIAYYHSVGGPCERLEITCSSSLRCSAHNMGSVRYCMSRLLATGNYLPAAMMNFGSGDSVVTRLGV